MNDLLRLPIPHGNNAPHLSTAVKEQMATIRTDRKALNPRIGQFEFLPQLARLGLPNLDRFVP